MGHRIAILASLTVAAAPHCLAQAQTQPATAPAPSVSEVVVTADKAGLLEKRPNGVVFGLDKPLLETPRSASLISATTIQRYGIQTIDGLTAIAPGTFTASFYGVPGTLNIRGTYAENYFQGFKLLENLGTYTTPVDDAAQIQIIRGPPSPLYGPGRVGGMLNFIPKSARDEGVYIDKPQGEVDATIGDYGLYDFTGQFGAPVDLGAVHGGIYAYGEFYDGGSYYNGISPQHELAELSGRFDIPGNWRLSFDAQYFHDSGDVQTPGWNRLTQTLIDNQIYITGQNTALSATPGVGYLSPNQTVVPARPPGIPYYSYPTLYTATGAGLYQTYAGAPLSPTAASVLDSGVGAVRLDRHDVYISPYDFSDTKTPTVYLGLEKSGLPLEGSLNLELFYDGLDNQRFVSYGYPAWNRANVGEGRATYRLHFTADGGMISVRNIAGVGDRYSSSRDMESYNSGVIALDRRDIAHGATPTDTICDPFTQGITGDTVPANCLGWETDIHSDINDFGVFDTTDILIGKKFDLILGGRYDAYNVTSSDTGILPYEPAGPVSAGKGVWTYTASFSYQFGFGLMPYVTYAMNSALLYGQSSDLPTDLVANGGWLQNSDLAEGGIKFQLLKGTLVGAIDVYRQTRPELSSGPLGNTTVDTVGKGGELEIRYLATRNLSFTFAGNLQHTEVIGPDQSFTYIPAYTVCGANLACEISSWGGAYAVNNFDTLPGRSGNYADLAIPHSVDSLYANYITDEHAWGRLGVTVGGTYTSKTSGNVENAVVYPSYVLVNASAFYQWGKNELDFNVNNLLNKLYFIPDADTYVNLAALPGPGTMFRFTYKRKF
jgi:iron complex outermembrane receptor protein